MSQGVGGGRPAIEFGEREIAQVESLASVLSKAQIADYFEVTEKTFRAIEARQPEVSTAYKKGKAKAIAMVGGNLLSQARAGNVAAMCFYLKTQAGWRETEVVEHSHEPISIEIVNPYNDDED